MEFMNDFLLSLIIVIEKRKFWSESCVNLGKDFHGFKFSKIDALKV